ncbi:hypothetical protein BT67DRAFT_201692 [Trichocladium antarcticum]|uniref:Uncharacterized protein n=1 Tax=Trichocladium antarcticum TaxID=1450529 RepID=A0AAN6ZG24_9PEZI|nr:hypothetical protein BT67DRAFT_201692 [Trichocladium antarcticum]
MRHTGTCLSLVTPLPRMGGESPRQHRRRGGPGMIKRPRRFTQPLEGIGKLRGCDGWYSFAGSKKTGPICCSSLYRCTLTDLIISSASQGQVTVLLNSCGT